jgi:hypothetical protein
MPYTKRVAIHGKSGLKKSLKYITNEEKTLGLNSGIHCSVTYGYEEMLEVHELFHHPTQLENRTGYHIIQSFYPEDPVTAEQVHSIGKELVATLYPKHQAIISTHQDQFHLHNHIVINSVNMETGYKLEDRLANKTEGLYGLRNASDEIGKRYGCRIDISDPIGKQKKKNYSGQLFEDRQQNQSYQILEFIQNGKREYISVENLYQAMIAHGYTFRRNRKGELTIKNNSSKRALNEKSLPPGLQGEGLEKFFERKRTNRCYELFSQIPESKTRIGKQYEVRCGQIETEVLLLNDYIQSKKLENEVYEMAGFVQSRYKEICLHNDMAKIISFCNQNQIENKKQVHELYLENKVEIHQLQISYEKKKKELKEQEKRDEPSFVLISRLRKECNRLYATLNYTLSQQKILEELEYPKLFNSSNLKQIEVSPKQIISKIGKQLVIELKKRVHLFVDESRVLLDQLKNCFRIFFIDEIPDVVRIENKKREMTYAQINSLLLDYEKYRNAEKNEERKCGFDNVIKNKLGHDVEEKTPQETMLIVK